MSRGGRACFELTLAQLTPILDDLGAGAPVALTELEGGGAQVFRVDLAGGDALVLKTYDELVRSGAAKEAHMSRLLAGLDIPHALSRFRRNTLLHRVIMWWWLRHVGVLPEGDHGELILALEEVADPLP